VDPERDCAPPLIVLEWRRERWKRGRRRKQRLRRRKKGKRRKRTESRGAPPPPPRYRPRSSDMTVVTPARFPVSAAKKQTTCNIYVYVAIEAADDGGLLGDSEVPITHEAIDACGENEAALRRREERTHWRPHNRSEMRLETHRG